MKIRSKRGGFTLIEMLIALIILVIISPQLVTWASIANRDKALAYQRQIYIDNVQIAEAFRAWARNENNGFLPEPYTNPATKDVLAPVDLLSSDPKVVKLRDYLARGTLSLDSVNTDGSASARAKVFQKMGILTHMQPVEGVTSLTVNLEYERGVIYQTICSKIDACNAGLVGSSPIYNSTWKSSLPDIKPIEFSTLDIQQSKWRLTWDRLKEVKHRMRETFTYQQLSSQAGDLTNHFYQPSTGSTDVGQLNCPSGWFDMSQSDVLEQYGIAPKEVFGLTAWGGVIDYCPDYDPQGTGIDTPPHNGALRININVTKGAAPNNTEADNLIIII